MRAGALSPSVEGAACMALLQGVNLLYCGVHAEQWCSTRLHAQHQVTSNAPPYTPGFPLRPQNIAMRHRRRDAPREFSAGLASHSFQSILPAAAAPRIP